MKHCKLLSSTLLLVSVFSRAGDDWSTRPMPIHFPLQNFLESKRQDLAKASDFSSGFSPLADRQVVDVEWQGAGQKLVLCGEGLDVWELAEPDREKLLIAGQGGHCFKAAPLLPAGQTKLYVLNIDYLDLENSSVISDDKNHPVPLSALMLAHLPEPKPEPSKPRSFRAKKKSYVRLSLYLETVADGLLTVLDSRKTAPNPRWSSNIFHCANVDGVIQYGGGQSTSSQSTPPGSNDSGSHTGASELQKTGTRGTKGTLGGVGGASGGSRDDDDDNGDKKKPPSFWQKEPDSLSDLILNLSHEQRQIFKNDCKGVYDMDFKDEFFSDSDALKKYLETLEYNAKSYCRALISRIKLDNSEPTSLPPDQLNFIRTLEWLGSFFSRAK